MKNKTRDMIECSLFTALLCIFGPLAVPLGAVPVTMTVFCVVLSAVVLGCKKSVVSVCVYILLGIVGLPVFSLGKSGLPVLLGPTGGYVWSYILMAFIIGFVSSRGTTSNQLAFSFLGSVISLLLCYVCAISQFVILNKTTMYEAFTVCVLPFVVIDVAKCFFAVWLGVKVRKKLPYKS